MAPRCLRLLSELTVPNNGDSIQTMRLATYIKLAGKALWCLVFIDSFCTGRNEAKTLYLYDGDASNLFVHDFVGDSDSLPDFIYSPTYPNGRIVTYYAQ